MKSLADGLARWLSNCVSFSFNVTAVPAKQSPLLLFHISAFR